MYPDLTKQLRQALSEFSQPFDVLLTTALVESTVGSTKYEWYLFAEDEVHAEVLGGSSWKELQENMNSIDWVGDIKRHSIAVNLDSVTGEARIYNLNRIAQWHLFEKIYEGDL